MTTQEEGATVIPIPQSIPTLPDSITSHETNDFIQKQKMKQQQLEWDLAGLEPPAHASDVHPGLHSEMFDSIRTMPTGGYGSPPPRRRQMSPEQQKLAALAEMSSEQLQVKLQEDFKTIFNQPMPDPLIDETSRFPKIMQLQHFSERKKAARTENRSMRETQTATKASLKKKGHEGVAEQRKASTKKVGPSFSQEPLLRAYNTAHQKIKANIAHAEAANSNQLQTARELKNIHDSALGTIDYLANSSVVTADQTKYMGFNSKLNQPSGYLKEVDSGDVTHQDLARGLNSKSTTMRPSDRQRFFHFPLVQQASGLEFVRTSSLQKQFPKGFTRSHRQVQDLNQTTANTISFDHALLSRTAANFVDMNVTSVRDYKAGLFEQNRREIQRLHTKIMKAKNVSSVQDLSHLEKQLSTKYREIYLQQSHQAINHMQHFGDLNELNKNFGDVLANVCAFRVELAKVLEMMVECYCSVFLQQFQTFHAMHNEKNERIEEVIASYKEKEHAFKEQMLLTQQKQDYCKKYVLAKDAEMKQMIRQNRMLEQQVIDLKEAQEKERLEANEQRLKDEPRKKELLAKLMYEPDYDRNKRVSIKQNPKNRALIMDPQTIEEFNEAMEDSRLETETRNDYADNLFVAVKRMLTNKMSDARTQTDLACMNNAVTYDYESSPTEKSRPSPSSEEAQMKAVTLDDKLHKLMEQQGIRLGEDSASKSDSSISQSRGHQVQEVAATARAINVSGLVSGGPGGSAGRGKEPDSPLRATTPPRNRKLRPSGKNSMAIKSRSTLETGHLPELGPNEGSADRSESPDKQQKSGVHRSAAQVASTSSLAFWHCPHCKKEVPAQPLHQNAQSQGGAGTPVAAPQRAGQKKYTDGYVRKDDSEILNIDGFIPVNLMDMPIQHQTQSLRQLGAYQPKRMMYLHGILDQLAITVAAKKMQANDEDVSQVKSTAVQWKLPLRIIAFCQNAIQHLDDNPETVETMELIPWARFKELIFDIYDHRVVNAPEINNSMNSSYCTLNEHLLIFFVEKYRTRERAEQKIVELVITLRYYYQHWERAKQFAQNLEFIYISQENKFQKKPDDRLDEYGDSKKFQQPHAFLKDTDLAANDVFCQEFFLHAYSLLSQDRKNFLESREGFTYVKIKHHDKVASKIISLIRGSGGDIQKWNLKVRRLVKRIKNKGNQESDYLDFDLITGMMMEEYRAQRANQRKDLERQFTRINPKEKGVLELDNFLEVLQGSMPSEHSKANTAENPFLKWPGKISQIRAYVFAVAASEKNTSEISMMHFIASCTRFALEAPTPTLTHRLALYGNSREVMSMLKEAEERYGPAKLNFDPSQFVSSTMNGQVQDQAKGMNSLDFKLAEREEEYQDLATDHYQDANVAEVEANELPRDADHADKGQRPDHIASLRTEYVAKSQAQNKDNSGKNPPNLLLAGVKFKIQALRQKHDQVTKGARERLSGLSPAEFDGFDYDFGVQDPSSRKVNELRDNKRQLLTAIKSTLTKKQIIIPSFDTTSKVFDQHLAVLRELHYHMERLKQAYYAQMDQRKTWNQVDQIITVLNLGIQYLDFPTEGLEEVDVRLSLKMEEIALMEEKKKPENIAIKFEQRSPRDSPKAKPIALNSFTSASGNLSLAAGKRSLPHGVSVSSVEGLDHIKEAENEDDDELKVEVGKTIETQNDEEKE